LKIKYIPTEQTLEEWIYGTMANIKQDLKLESGFIGGIIKKIFD
jgi:hypothetical protein